MEFNPPIPSRSTDELILIANSPEDWDSKAVDQAKKELAAREISIEEQQRKLKAWDRQAEIDHKKELQRRAAESFGIFSLIWMALKWPKTILWDWSLKKEGYNRKHKERIYSIGSGILFTIGIILWASHDIEISKRKWQNEVNSQDIYEWEKSHYTEEEIVANRTDAIEKAIHLINENEKNGTPTFLIIDGDTISNQVVQQLKGLNPASIRDVVFQSAVGSTPKDWIVIKLLEKE